MTIEKTELMLQFEKASGKNAIWNGQITLNFQKWAAKQKAKESIEEKPAQITLSDDITPQIKFILNKFQQFEIRIAKLENAVFQLEPQKKIEEITKEQFHRTINTAYNSLEKRIGDFVSISALTRKIQDFIPWTTEKIHNELYKLFMEYKVDLQPGKKIDGEPLNKDGQSYVWLKLK